MSSHVPKAVVLLSGGVDSTTTLAIVRHEGFQCHALSFDYGQRHRCELEAACRIAKSMKVADHRIVKIDLGAFGGSALTDDISVPKDRPLLVPLPLRGEGRVRGGGSRANRDQVKPSPPAPLPKGEGGEAIPITYVPARNTIFLSFALAYAEVLGSTDIFIGVNAIDYSGYPDCRPQYIQAFEAMANLATKMGVEGQRIRIHTPLIDLRKAQIIKRGIQLGVDYSLTFSCYDPDKHGRPCEHCDSCLLRAEGFRTAGIDDPAGP